MHPVESYLTSLHASLGAGTPETSGPRYYELLLFSSKDDNLTKSHVLWLESALIDLATTAKRTTLTNVTVPQAKAISKAEQATMLEFLENLRLVAQAAGYSYFTKAKVRNVGPAPVAQFSLHKVTQGIKAQAIQSDEGFVVLAGSRASGNPTGNTSSPSMPSSPPPVLRPPLSQDIPAPAPRTGATRLEPPSKACWKKRSKE